MSDENISADGDDPTPTDEVGESLDAAEEVEGFLGTPWSRRTFLKAAALGTAAAAVFQKGPGLKNWGPAAAYANDLSNKPCTAEDVEIVGAGTIINEPCSCTTGGTFTANVKFTVRNSTSTGRYCIGLHLVPDGVVFTQGFDLVLEDASGSSTAPGKSGGESFHDTDMFATIPNFPCSVGRVCFGQAGTTRGKCDPGTCSTIAWSTTPGDAGCTGADQSPPGGQCRHEQICIVGFGATLDCVGSDCSTAASCSVNCGGSLKLLAGVTGGTPGYVYTLSDGTNTQTFPGTGETNDTSHCFTVSPTATTTYTLTVSDHAGCQRTATKTVTVTGITVGISASGNSNCDGKLTFSATGVSGCTSASLTWKVDGTTITSTTTTDEIHVEGTGKDKVLKYRNINSGAGGCHTVRVEVNCDGCPGNAEKKVCQCVGTKLDCTGNCTSTAT